MIIVVAKKGFRSLLSFKVKAFPKQALSFSGNKSVLQAEKKLETLNLSNKNGDIKDKIVFNSIVKNCRTIDLDEKIEINRLEKEKLSQYEKQGAPVLALKYFTEEFVNEKLSKNYESSKDTENAVHEVNLPYKIFHDVEIENSVENTESENDDGSTQLATQFSEIKDKSCMRPRKTWMKDYNKYVEVAVKLEAEEESDEEDDSDSVEVNYGSADPSQPVSSVPCGGCGAHLHCQDPSIPGYLPKEIFVGQRPDQLQALVCQRCHFLREYNTALSVNVNPSVYPQMLSKIRGQRALVILVVDITDFPCSIWPGILDIIGPKRPLVVVGNKVDLLQDWSRDMLQRVQQALEAQLPRRANVLHTALVSAKTGFGVEELINTLYDIWEYRGDVYLVGCTNVGKSMLFNALLQSDYCKTKAVDLIQRATTAPWPGTTLNLLKFPIMRPQGWRLAIRSARLRQQRARDLENVQEGGAPHTPQMITRISRTFAQGNIDRYKDEFWDDPFAMPKMKTLRQIQMPGSGLDPSDPLLAESKWLYDTPGVITPDQIIDLLTTQELMLTLPRQTLVPRTFSVWAGQSLMVGGLGRLDYISGTANIKMTVMAAPTLPVTICFTPDMETVYNHYLGSAALAVPCGGPKRLRVWPGLHAAPEFVLKGTGWQESCGDVVLSSAGWIAVTACYNGICQLQAWTPEARGIHVRIPPVLPRAVAVKGQRMFKSPAYGLFNKKIKNKKLRLS